MSDIAVREVQPSVFSVENDGGIVVSTRSIFGICENPEIDALVIGFDVCHPWANFGPGNKVNSFVSGSTALSDRSVCDVLPLSSDSDVGPAIVESVSVRMINDHSRFGVQDETMHVNVSSIDDRSGVQMISSGRRFNHTPAELQYAVGVGSVNNSKHIGELATVKGNMYDCTHGGLTLHHRASGCGLTRRRGVFVYPSIVPQLPLETAYQMEALT